MRSQNQPSIQRETKTRVSQPQMAASVTQESAVFMEEIEALQHHDDSENIVQDSGEFMCQMECSDTPEDTRPERARRQNAGRAGRVSSSQVDALARLAAQRKESMKHTDTDAPSDK